MITALIIVDIAVILKINVIAFVDLFIQKVVIWLMVHILLLAEWVGGVLIHLEQFRRKLMVLEC